MSFEKIKNAVEYGVKDIKDRVELSILLKQGDNFIAVVHRINEEDCRGEKLNVPGYNSKDILFSEAKKAGSGVNVNILVTRGGKYIGSVWINNK